MQEAGTVWDLRSSSNFETVLLMLGVSLFLYLVPVVKLLRRTGHHAAWCLLAVFPGLNLIAFWLFAFKPWPTDKSSTDVGN